MTTLPKTRAAIQKRMRAEATSLPVAMEAVTKTRTRQIALKASEIAANALTEIDFDNLETLGKVTGTLSNTYIESLSAAKIISATMLGTTLTLAGTDASANKTSLVMIGDAMLRINDGTSDQLTLSNSGMRIGASSEGISPTVQAGRGIFNLGTKNSGITYFENPSRRGWSVRADGVGAGGVNGHLFLIATGNPAATPTDVGNWASLEAQVTHGGVGAIAGRAAIIVRNALWSAGPARIGGALDVIGSAVIDTNLTVGGSQNLSGNLNILNGRYQSNGTLATFGGPLRTAGGITTETGNFSSNGQVMNLITGGNATVIDGALQVKGSFLPDYFSGNINLAANGGSTGVLSHGLGTVPRIALAQYTNSGDSYWHPVIHGVLSMATGVNTTGVYVTNNSAEARTIRIMLWK